MCEQHPGLLSASLNSIVNASLKILVDEVSFYANVLYNVDQCLKSSVIGSGCSKSVIRVSEVDFSRT